MKSAQMRKRIRSLRLALCALPLLVVASASGATFDVILRGGTILDGTGFQRYQADVAINRGYIARIGDLSADTAALDLNVKGQFVASGFINVHGHPQTAAVRKAENMLTQAVTTEFGNADGFGDTDLRLQAREFAAAGLATNLGLYIGFNAAWTEVMGAEDQHATEAQIKRMQGLILAGLDAGAWGVSAGLDYKPAYYADTDEVVAVVAVARHWRTSFPNHERLTPEAGYSSLTGIRETIDIAERAGLVPVITHIKAQGAEQLKSRDILDSMDEATRRGHYTAADIYPYLAGANNVRSLLFPGWALEGGEDALYARFKDPQVRERLAAEIDKIMRLRFSGPGGVFVSSLKRELTDFMAEWQVSGGEAVIRLNEQYRGELPGTYLRFGAEEDLVRMMRYPNSAIACDCGSSLTMTGHPRGFGTFPRVLGRYVREQGVLTWEDAIRKMTGLPASMVGLVDRGLLAVGMAADVVVIDPSSISDKATFETPLKSEGVRHVFVNGVLALRDGTPTGEQGGLMLLRSRNMPSRPMTADRSRSLAGAASLQDSGRADEVLRVRMDLTHNAGRSAAMGTLSVRQANGAVVFEADEFGVLQAHDKWASITGYGRLASGETRAFNLIVDEGGRALAGDKAVILNIEKSHELSSRRYGSLKITLARDH